MQAGIFDRAQSWRGIFAWPPKPRPPPKTSNWSCRNPTLRVAISVRANFVAVSKSAVVRSSPL